MSPASPISLYALNRRRMLGLLTAAGLSPAARAQSSDAAALRTELERTYLNWLTAMRRSDVTAFAAHTSRYRQMCLRNEVVSLRQPWPSAVFRSVIQAPDLSRLTFVDATAVGDTARAVYFGRVDFALDIDVPVTPENPLIVRFLKEGGVWKFDWIQYVNLGPNEDARRDARSGGRQWLEAEEFRLTGRYPEIPKACREPYQIAALSIRALGCRVTVDVNRGTHVETVENNHGGRVITGGLQKGQNVVTITPVNLTSGSQAPDLEVSIVTRPETYRPSIKLWSWKPSHPAAQWQAKYDASFFVKSRASAQ